VRLPESVADAYVGAAIDDASVDRFTRDLAAQTRSGFQYGDAAGRIQRAYA
jgi:hypothetical protein